MRALTVIENEQQLEELNLLPIGELRVQCVVQPMKLELNNGRITSASISHRDYVSVLDGRNNYIEKDRMVCNA